MPLNLQLSGHPADSTAGESGYIMAQDASTNTGPHHHVCLPLTHEMIVKIEKASALRAEVAAARCAYDTAYSSPTQAQTEAKIAVDCCEADILELKVKLLRQQHAKTRAQTAQLISLNNAFEKAKRRLDECDADVDALAVRAQDAENRLLDLFMEIHLLLLTGSTQSRAMGIGLVDRQDAPSEGAAKLAIDAESTDESIPEAAEARQPIMPARNERDEDQLSCVQIPVLEQAQTQTIEIHSQASPAAAVSTDGQIFETSKVRCEHYLAPLLDVTSKLVGTNVHCSDDNVEKETAALGGSNTMHEIYEESLADRTKEEANLALQHCESLYWNTHNELVEHRDTYDDQYAKFVNDNPDKSLDQCKDCFGPQHLKEGMLISRKLSDAEAAMKAARVEARKAGVNQPNSHDQESDFLTAIDEGEGPAKKKAQWSIDTCDRKRIHEWVNAPNKTSNLQLVEVQYALSGAEVEFWESTSSCGDPKWRAKVDNEKVSRKRRKISSMTDSRIPACQDTDGGTSGNASNDGGEEDFRSDQTPPLQRRGRPWFRSVRNRQKRAASWPSSPDGYAGYQFDFVHPILMRFPDRPRAKVSRPASHSSKVEQLTNIIQNEIPIQLHGDIIAKDLVGLPT